MSRDLEHIDHLFRENLQNATIPAPDGAWEAIASKSAVGSVSASGASGIAAVKVALVVAAVGISGLVIYNIAKPEVKPKMEESEREKPVAVNPSVKSNSKDDWAVVEKSKSKMPNTSNDVKKQSTEKTEDNTPSDQVKAVLPSKPVVFISESEAPKFNDSPIKTGNTNISDEVVVVLDNKGDKAKDVDKDIPKKVKQLHLFPDVFTPNGDRANDSFYIEMDEPVLYQLTIRSTAGELLFVSTDPNIRWDGKYKGRELPDGFYIATLVYQFEKDLMVETKRQKVELRRIR